MENKIVKIEIEALEKIRRDAARYRFLRNEDYWGCDNEYDGLSWSDLGQASNSDFDAIIDQRIDKCEISLDLLNDESIV